jgi:hypothetical protein
MTSSAPGFAQRLETYRPSKAVLGWCCVLSVIATMIVGFSWGGWVTGGTAQQNAAKAATEARAELAASICVDRFGKGPDAAGKLVALKATDSWKRRQFLEEGGWVTLPGLDKPIDGAAALCAESLVDSTAPMKAAGTSG